VTHSCNEGWLIEVMANQAGHGRHVTSASTAGAANHRGRYQAAAGADDLPRLPDDYDVNHSIPQRRRGEPRAQGAGAEHEPRREARVPTAANHDGEHFGNAQRRSPRAACAERAMQAWWRLGSGVRGRPPVAPGPNFVRLQIIRARGAGSGLHCVMKRDGNVVRIEGAAPDWGMLHRNYNLRVHRRLLSCGVAYSDVADIAQEVWTRLAVNFRTGKLAHLEFPAIALAQASLSACDYRRHVATTRCQGKRQGRLAPQQTWPKDDPPDLASAGAAHCSAAVARALAQLSPEQSEIARQLFGDPPQTIRQVAARLKTSKEHVSSTRERVRALLRRCL